MDVIIITWCTECKVGTDREFFYALGEVLG